MARFPPLMVACCLWTAASALAAPPLATPTDSQLVQAEQEAQAVLMGTPWLATEAELEDGWEPLRANLALQEDGVTRAQIEADEAEVLLRRVRGDVIAVEEDRRAQQAMLQAFVIEAFVLANGDIDPTPDAASVASRRDAPIETVTEDLLRSLTASQIQLEALVRERAEREQNWAVAEATVSARRSSRDRAEAMVDDYRTRLGIRDEEIQARTDEAIGRNEEPRLVSVGGFLVHVDLAEPMAALLAAASEDGIEFGGWGHRRVDQQIVLRRSHCGDSGYALFDMPAGQCFPPTARPGYSQHELGLAIDFTEKGSTLTRSSPGFGWLQMHGAEYGLFNLPSEPWHWSTTGR